MSAGWFGRRPVTSADVPAVTDQVRTLHQPILNSPHLDCEGCDYTDYGDDYYGGGAAPDWPCRTAALVYTVEEIETERHKLQAAMVAERAVREERLAKRAQIEASAAYDPTPGQTEWVHGHPKVHIDGICICEPS